jgi:pimeloyl-ACP methyl ester carboxylesterase
VIRRLLLVVAAPVVALLAVGPVVDRLALRLMAAPRRLPEESGMAPALDRLGGEVVRLRSRDGVRLTGRWLAAEPEPRPVAVSLVTADPRPGSGDRVDGESAGEAWAVDPREAILVLHGWSGSVTPDLVEHGPYLRRTAAVLGLDFRGHGGSDDGPTTFGLLEVEDVAGALAWLGERGIRRVALVGTSMGGITALAAVAVLGDGRLAAADRDLDAPAATVDAPRPRICAVVADSVAPELAAPVASHLRVPFGRQIADHAFARMARHVGGDPRDTQPIDVIGLLEDMPLLLVHGSADTTLSPRDAQRLADAAPAGSRHLVIEGAGHGRAHAADPVRYEAEVTSLVREAFRRARP